MGEMILLCHAFFSHGFIISGTDFLCFLLGFDLVFKGSIDFKVSDLGISDLGTVSYVLLTRFHHLTPSPFTTFSHGFIVSCTLFLSFPFGFHIHHLTHLFSDLGTVAYALKSISP